MSWHIHHGDCVEVMAGMEAGSVDAVVTDPPYELGFMGKKWDSMGIAYSLDLWRGVLRVIKPGGHVLAFGGSRTYHRMACAIEDAGFEIRDSLMWLYGTGFPKSLNLPSGVGTALKPAHEPIVMARKPLGSTVAACMLKHGTGGLNIDGCRIESGDDYHSLDVTQGVNGARTSWETRRPPRTFEPSAGRWPANLLLDPEAAAMLDEQSGELTSGSMAAGTHAGRKGSVYQPDNGRPLAQDIDGSSGGASRFFYVAKPSRFDRDVGLDDLPARTAGQATDREEGSDGLKSPRAGAGRTSEGVRNHHPTVKPVLLMEWLVRLVTPPGGLVLDPFLGSGTTGAAAVRQAFRFIGIEREAEYVEIAKRRIDHWSKGQLDLAGRVA